MKLRKFTRLGLCFSTIYSTHGFTSELQLSPQDKMASMMKSSLKQPALRKVSAQNKTLNIQSSDVLPKNVNTKDQQAISSKSSHTKPSGVHVNNNTPTNIRPMTEIPTSQQVTTNSRRPLPLPTIPKVNVTMEECENNPWLTPAPKELISAAYTNAEARKILLKRLYDGFIPEVLQNTINVKKLIQSPTNLLTVLDPGLTPYINYFLFKLGKSDVYTDGVYPKGSPTFCLDLAEKYKNPVQLYLMGVLLQDGIALPKDNKKSVQLLRLAADQGYAHAQYRLGLAYMSDDLGVKKDFKEAIKLLQVAAEPNHDNSCFTLGYAPAQYTLGLMYQKSHGVEQELDEARRLLSLAANQKYGPAMDQLGVMYQSGKGFGGQAITEAVKLYEMSVLEGSAEAQNNLAVIYINGYVCKEYQNSQQIPINLKEAKRLLELAVMQKNSAAQNNLGILYERGLGVEQDYQKAIELYKLSAEQGSNDARVNLGLLYERGKDEHGKGVLLDFAEATKWYSLAATLGHPVAQNKLGEFYMSGTGRPDYQDESLRQLDFKAAVEHFRNAAMQGNPEAQNNLGNAYEHGKGVDKDYEVASKWYLLSVAQNCAAAQNNLGVLFKTGNVYFDGDQLPPNYKEAIVLFELSSEQGYAPALINLAEMYSNGLGVEKSIAKATKLCDMAFDKDKNSRLSLVTLLAIATPI